MKEPQLPREKALAYGMKALTDAELMAIVFGTGIQGKDVHQMCAEILDDHRGRVAPIAQMDAREFVSRYKGIGPAKALTLLAALELGVRAAAENIRDDDPSISTSRLAFDYMHSRLYNLGHEEFWVLLLKNNLKPIRDFRVGQGGLTATAVDIKIIMREALMCHSSAMMIFHNHPSGTLRPSAQDENLTRRIADASRLLDIRLLDHIIIGRDTYFSFRDEGLL